MERLSAPMSPYARGNFESFLKLNQAIENGLTAIVSLRVIQHRIAPSIIKEKKHLATYKPP